MLSQQAKEFYAFIRDNPVEPDGTIALLKPNEKIYQAVARTYGIEARKRRGYDKPIAELIKWGFLLVVGNRVALSNWPALLGWSKGRPPAMTCKPDPMTLARLARETSTGLLRDCLGTSPTPLRDLSGTSPTLLRDFSRSNGAKSLDAGPGKSASNPRLGLDRLGVPPAGVPLEADEGTGGDDHDDHDEQRGRRMAEEVDPADIVDEADEVSW